MNADGRADAVISRISGIGREMAERRALRDSNTAAARQESEQNLRDQGRIAGKLAERLNELGRRQRDAGGWATEQSMADRNHIMGLGVQKEEDEESRRLAQLTGRSQPAPSEPAPRTQPPQQDGHTTEPIPRVDPGTEPADGPEPLRPQISDYPVVDEDDDFADGPIMRRR